MQTTELVEHFFAQFTKLHYKKGEVLLRADDTPTGVLYLKSGFVKQSFVARNGDTIVLHIYKPGSYFPMTWVINDTQNRYFFEALTTVFIYRAPREDVRRFLHENPQVGEHFLSRILLGVSGLLSRMEQLVLESAYQKTIALLLYYATTFHDDKYVGRFVVKLTHREIAAWIGTTRETASLQIEALKRKKLISYNGRNIVVVDKRALERESELVEMNEL